MQPYLPTLEEIETGKAAIRAGHPEYVQANRERKSKGLPPEKASRSRRGILVRIGRGIGTSEAGGLVGGYDPQRLLPINPTGDRGA